MIYLEWVAWSGVLVSILMYGYPGWKGPLSGILATALFLILAGITQSLPMITVNIIIVFLHARNLRRACDEARKY